MYLTHNIGNASAFPIIGNASAFNIGNASAFPIMKKLLTEPLVKINFHKVAQFTKFTKISRVRKFVVLQYSRIFQVFFYFVGGLLKDLNCL